MQDRLHLEGAENSDFSSPFHTGDNSIIGLLRSLLWRSKIDVRIVIIPLCSVPYLRRDVLRHTCGVFAVFGVVCMASPRLCPSSSSHLAVDEQKQFRRECSVSLPASIASRAALVHFKHLRHPCC